jgi:hypothetical protein
MFCELESVGRKMSRLNSGLPAGARGENLSIAYCERNSKQV